VIRRRTRSHPAAAVAAAVVTALVLAACGDSSPSATPSSPASVPADPGRQLYLERCAVCHGPQGQGGAGSRLANGAVVRRFPRVENEEAIVRNGTAAGVMPAFGEVLTPDEIRAVVRYTRGL